MFHGTSCYRRERLMSRIGKVPIVIPSGVTAEMKDNTLVVRGSKGELTCDVLPGINVEIKDNEIIVTRENDEKKVRSFHGLQRSLFANMITGVSEGFKKILEVQGVGFKSSISGMNLKLSLGFSHDIEFPIPSDVTVTAEKNVITVEGIDKQRVGQVAAQIREFKKPEPYKGKGIRYQDEYVIRKAGKTAKA